ncbi:hypothetical protein M231_04798 [Tremella mesenterica]|uniref:Uncharacterized protein n=1 Tax=Tremella mesenterica TaxID=5217 RepID=A0A4Q1BJL7_TREME|nr:hypothetical protein M231_04798 [Tremella mesenterica]
MVMNNLKDEGDYTRDDHLNKQVKKLNYPLATIGRISHIDQVPWFSGSIKTELVKVTKYRGRKRTKKHVKLDDQQKEVREHSTFEGVKERSSSLSLEKKAKATRKLWKVWEQVHTTMVETIWKPKPDGTSEKPQLSCENIKEDQKETPGGDVLTWMSTRQFFDKRYKTAMTLTSPELYGHFSLMAWVSLKPDSTKDESAEDESRRSMEVTPMRVKFEVRKIPDTKRDELRERLEGPLTVGTRC